ncbi:MAG TPA: NADH-quinone oxidoreductase subunit C [Solirubrobacterales bacterium]|nr:NADH-quinone oxidoreductase subunit C [Solirubrobacterales bacterium]
MPDAPGLELILAEINRDTPGAVIDTSFDREQAALIVDATQIRSTITWLRDTPGHEYTFLSSVHGVDYLPNEPRFAVHYELLNRERHERLRVKALLSDPAVETEAGSDVPPIGAPDESRPSGGTSEPATQLLPHIDSVVDLFPTADFQEREIYDFFGIVFDGHPDLRRILMPDDYVGWPQRRDFPVGGEPVIFTKDEVTNPGWWQ